VPGSSPPFHKPKMEKMCRSNAGGKSALQLLGLAGAVCIGLCHGCLQLLPIGDMNSPGMVCSSLQSSDRCSDHYGYYSGSFRKESQ